MVLKLIFLLVLILNFSKVSCSSLILLKLLRFFVQLFFQLRNHFIQAIFFLGNSFLKFLNLSDEPILLFLDLSFKMLFVLMLLIDNSLEIIDHLWCDCISFFIACSYFFQLSFIILFWFLTLIFEKLLSLTEWLLGLWGFNFKLLTNL